MVSRSSKRAVSPYLEAFESRKALPVAKCNKILIGNFVHIMWIDAPDQVALVIGYDRRYKELTVVASDSKSETIEYDQVLGVVGTAEWPKLPKGTVQ